MIRSGKWGHGAAISVRALTAALFLAVLVSAFVTVVNSAVATRRHFATSTELSRQLEAVFDIFGDQSIVHRAQLTELELEALWSETESGVNAKLIDLAEEGNDRGLQARYLGLVSAIETNDDVRRQSLVVAIEASLQAKVEAQIEELGRAADRSTLDRSTREHIGVLLDFAEVLEREFDRSQASLHSGVPRFEVDVLTGSSLATLEGLEKRLEGELRVVWDGLALSKPHLGESGPSVLVNRETAQSLYSASDQLVGLAAFGNSLYNVTQQSIAESRADERRSLFQDIAVATLRAAVGIIFVVVFRRRVTRPLQKLAERVSLLAVGDLHAATQPAATLTKSATEVAEVGNAVNDLTQALKNVAERVEHLAKGDYETSPTLPTSPSQSGLGPIGASVNQSVEYLRRTTRRMQISESLARAVVDGASDSVWTLDEQDRVINCNPAALALMETDWEGANGAPLGSFLFPAERSGTLGVSDSDERFTGEWTVAHQDSERTVLLSQHQISSGADRLSVVFARDISERKAMESALEYRVNHCSLTGLLNRSGGLAKLEREIERSNESLTRELRCGILIVDLDGFKDVNDTKGHAVGDRVLEIVAARFTEVAEPGESVVRLGGDEFLIILENVVSMQKLSARGREFADVLRPLLVLGRHKVSISASVGGFLGGEDDSAGSMMSKADLAMYKAKELGTGLTIVYDEKLETERGQQRLVEQLLKVALAEGTIELHYQPILDVETEAVIGSEALLRGTIGGRRFDPGELVLAAERSGLILDLDRHILDLACQQIVKWQSEGKNIPVSVNISGRHINQADLATTVTEVAGCYPIEAGLLRIELTETHLLHDLKSAKEALEKVRLLGVGVSMDDFGTGFTSISSLRELPVDVVKIDRSFVEFIGTSSESILTSMIDLARALNRRVVAEGIETAEQFAFLKEYGCDYAQGYYFSPALPPLEFEKWIVQNPGLSSARAITSRESSQV